MITHDHQLIVGLAQPGAGLDRPQRRLGSNRPGDRVAVVVVGLGGAAGSAAFRGAPRRHLPNVVTGGHQPFGKMPAMPR